MPSPIGIKYYRCINSGIGTVIYPQLRACSDINGKPLWDGRETAFSLAFLTDVGDSVIVNLGTECVPEDTPFHLSVNTVHGIAVHNEAQSFVYDPNSNLMAIGRHYGPMDEGSLQYMGTHDYDDEDARREGSSPSNVPLVTQEIIYFLDRGSSKDSTWRYIAKAKWPAGLVGHSLYAASAFLGYQLTSKRYTIAYTNIIPVTGSITTFRINPPPPPGYLPPPGDDVLATLINQWKGALEATKQKDKQWDPTDLGIKPNS